MVVMSSRSDARRSKKRSEGRARLVDTATTMIPADVVLLERGLSDESGTAAVRTAIMTIAEGGDLGPGIRRCADGFRNLGRTIPGRSGACIGVVYGEILAFLQVMMTYRFDTYTHTTCRIHVHSFGLVPLFMRRYRCSKALSSMERAKIGFGRFYVQIDFILVTPHHQRKLRNDLAAVA